MKKQSLGKGICSYPSGCDHEGIRLFNAPPVDGWLCEDHFQEILKAAAHFAADARRKADAEWLLHLDKYLHEHNLKWSELTEDHAQAALGSWRKKQ